MNTLQKLPRHVSISQEQLDHYLHFLQENPDFLANKNDRTDPNKVMYYWNVLTKELNVLRGPVRTAPKWKQVFSHYKQQFQSRARKIKVHKNLTPPSDKISNFEEKAVEVFSAALLEGLILL